MLDRDKLTQIAQGFKCNHMGIHRNLLVFDKVLFQQTKLWKVTRVILFQENKPNMKT